MKKCLSLGIFINKTTQFSREQPKIPSSHQCNYYLSWWEAFSQEICVADETVLIGSVFFKGHSNFPADSLRYGSHPSKI